MIKILTTKEINNLKVIKENGDKISSTDFYELQSGERKIDADEGKVSFVSKFTRGMRGHKLENGEWNDYIIRPAISLYEIYKNNEDVEIDILKGKKEIEYGEYPQNKVDDKNLENELENLYQIDQLVKTKKEYTPYLNKKNKYQEYKYKNNKYIRMTHTTFENHLKDRSGIAIKKNKEISWIKVEPIKWLVDTDKQIIIPKDILGNIQPTCIKNRYDETKELERFLIEYFIQEIQQNKINSNIATEKVNDLVDIMTMLYPNENKKEKSKVKIYSKKDIRD